ncbi:hypothetical protein NMY22_g16724 [Coprinellus aureogranulatus]|nr:hypothetical protein NMY22_g16724 [Coprinellus aureogranulatus]
MDKPRRPAVPIPVPTPYSTRPNGGTINGAQAGGSSRYPPSDERSYPSSTIPLVRVRTIVLILVPGCDDRRQHQHSGDSSTCCCSHTYPQAPLNTQWEFNYRGSEWEYISRGSAQYEGCKVFYGDSGGEDARWLSTLPISISLKLCILPQTSASTRRHPVPSTSASSSTTAQYPSQPHLGNSPQIGPAHYPQLRAFASPTSTAPHPHRPTVAQPTRVTALPSTQRPSASPSTSTQRQASSYTQPPSALTSSTSTSTSTSTSVSTQRLVSSAAPSTSSNPISTSTSTQPEPLSDPTQQPPSSLTTSSRSTSTYPQPSSTPSTSTSASTQPPNPLAQPQPQPQPYTTGKFNPLRRGRGSGSALPSTSTSTLGTATTAGPSSSSSSSTSTSTTSTSKPQGPVPPWMKHVRSLPPPPLPNHPPLTPNSPSDRNAERADGLLPPLVDERNLGPQRHFASLTLPSGGVRTVVGLNGVCTMLDAYILTLFAVGVGGTGAVPFLFFCITPPPLGLGRTKAFAVMAVDGSGVSPADIRLRHRSVLALRRHFFSFHSLTTPTRDNDRTMPHVMVISSEGYFYLYSIDLENGGECGLVKQYRQMDEDILRFLAYSYELERFSSIHFTLANDWLMRTSNSLLDPMDTDPSADMHDGKA